MKLIPIEIFRNSSIIHYEGKGQTIIISIEDECFFKSHQWYFLKTTQKEEKYYLTGWINGKNQYLHRTIIDAKKGEIVDHKNRNPLDCSRENLRIVSSKINSLNRTQILGKKNSNYKGVFKNKSLKNPYYSAIQVRGGKNIHCGSFKTEIEASEAYKKMVKELYDVDN